MPPAAPDVIPRDLPCITCGYNLRTQPTTAHCPECDTPAAQTFQAYATRLAGADRRWLRKLTSAAAWLTLSMLIPAAFAFFKLPEFKTHGQWLTDDRQMLALVLLPYACALVACWQLGAREPNPLPDQVDQPITRWALRLTAVTWCLPVFLWVGPFQRVRSRGYHLDPEFLRNDSVQMLLLALSWSGVVSTLLVYRRLKHVADRIPSRLLSIQSTFISSQLPIAALLISTFHERGAHYGPDAIRYSTSVPLPGAGMPWPLALTAFSDYAPIWRFLVRSPWIDAQWLLAAWAAVTSIAALFVAIQFLIALIRVRRADPELSTYSREVLTSQSPQKSPTPREPSPASSV